MKFHPSKRFFIIAFVGLIAVAPLALWAYRWSHRDYIRWSDYRLFYMSELPVEPKDFKTDFDEICRKVRLRYAYTEEKRLDMDSIHDAFAGRLDTVRLKTDYAMLLREFFGCLQAGHADIRFRPYHIGNDAVVVEDRVFISRPSEAALKAGLRDKDEIVAVNHVPAREWIRANERYISASSVESRYRASAQEITYDYTDSVRIFGIRRDGEEMELTVSLLRADQRSGKEWHRLEKRQLTSETGYIAINMLDEAEVVADFAEALEEYRHLPYLIVDVRENGGGNSRYGDAIAGYIVRHDCLNWKGDRLPMNADHYPGQVYVLMGPSSFSAAETFLVALKESGDVVLVGEPSAGDMGGVVLPYKSSHGICFRLPVADRLTSPGGHPSEGSPIQPDHLVHQTVADFMADKDTPIEFVLQRIRLKMED